MSTRSARPYFGPFFKICWVLIFLAACSNKPTSPMKVTATISPEPKVGQDAVLHVEIGTSRVRAPNTTATITLPSGIELVEGDLEWQGDLEADQTVGFDVTIQVTDEGEWPISVNAFSSVTGGQTGFGAGKTLYVRSSTDSAQVIEDVDYPFPTVPVFQLSPESDNYDELKNTLMLSPETESLAPNDPANAEISTELVCIGSNPITVSGNVTYAVREQYSTATTLKPLGRVRVELRDMDGSGGNRLLDTAYTDAAGVYSITVYNSDPFDGHRNRPFASRFGHR